MRCLITGNGSGIGAAIHASLVLEGHDVLGTHDARGRLIDISIGDEIDYLLDAALSTLGGIDVLVNNAGILDEEPFGKLTTAGIERIFRVNVVAPLLLAQGAVGLGAKVIINIGSGYGTSGAYGAKPTYAASKAALHNMTLSLSRLLGPRNIRVATISPGIIETPIHRGNIARHENGHSNLGRIGNVADVVQAVRFVIDNDYVTGTNIEVHGGR